MKLLSVIVPCYNEEETVADFYAEFIKNKDFFEEKGLDYEIIYVDDGSRDRTVKEIKKSMRKISGCIWCPFREISEKRRPCTRDLSTRTGTMW